MNIEPQTMITLSEILGVVMRHDPITMARVAAVYDRRTEPRKKLDVVRSRRKS